MYTLREFQEKAVTRLLEFTIDALEERRQQTPILLKAPTGSGKTVMMAAMIERLIEELPMRYGSNTDVAFIWLAPNTLHIQSYNSLKHLYSDGKKLRCLDLSELSGNPVLNNKELLFVNWSTLDKTKNIWRKENETNTNIETLVENTKAEGIKIVLVIDEAHLSAFRGTQAIAVRKLIAADVEVFVTATPNFQTPDRTVTVFRKNVIAEQLIKKGVRINIGLNPEEQNGENVNIHLLRTAFKKKQELQELYNKELGEGIINPLILIQLPSDNASLSEEDEGIKAAVVGLLNTEFNISINTGKLAIWLSGEKVKDGLEDINGFQDVLIFKQAIAQGWDCPRAAILVSYRNISSPDFGVQTVGRILRMPHQRHYNNDALNYGYVYSNIETNQIRFVPDDSDFFDLQIATRQECKGWLFDEISKEQIVNDRAAAGILTSAFEQKFFAVMEQRYGVSQLPDIDLYTIETLESVPTQQSANKQALIQNGWEFVIDDHQIHIPTNLDVDPYEVTAIALNSEQIRDFAITTAQYSELFDRFCFDNITRLNRSKSWKKLRETLINFAEYYLSIFETDARRLFLYPQNKALLVQHIVTALENFDAWQKAKGNEKRRVETETWVVPEVRYYSELYNREEIDQHALEPFFEYKNVSNPEKEFKKYLETYSSEIDWWYKNGDQGKEHFAISYHNHKNELKLFYVDFIIRFKSGKIGLFDTKTKRSDHDAPAKHNALVEYVRVQNLNSGKIMLGGIMIPEETGSVLSFRYCLNTITDTNDLTGWTYFDPAQINAN